MIKNKFCKLTVLTLLTSATANIYADYDQAEAPAFAYTLINTNPSYKMNLLEPSGDTNNNFSCRVEGGREGTPSPDGVSCTTPYGTPSATTSGQGPWASLFDEFTPYYLICANNQICGPGGQGLDTGSIKLDLVLSPDGTTASQALTERLSFTYNVNWTTGSKEICLWDPYEREVCQNRPDYPFGVPLIQCTDIYGNDISCPLNLRMQPVPVTAGNPLSDPTSTDTCQAMINDQATNNDGPSLNDGQHIGFGFVTFPGSPLQDQVLAAPQNPAPLIKTNTCAAINWIADVYLKNINCPDISTDAKGNIVWHNPNDTLYWQVADANNIPNILYPYINAVLNDSNALTYTSTDEQQAGQTQFQDAEFIPGKNSPYFNCYYYNDENDAYNFKNPMVTLSYLGDQYETATVAGVLKGSGPYYKPLKTNYIDPESTSDFIFKSSTASYENPPVAGLVTDCDDPNATTCTNDTDHLSYFTAAQGVEACALSSENNLFHNDCNLIKDASFNSPQGIVTEGGNVYIANQGNNTVSVCKIANIVGKDLSCTAFSDPTLDQPYTLNIYNQVLYVGSAWSGLSACPINTDGSLAACQGINQTSGVFLSLVANNNDAYVATLLGGIAHCTLKTDGTFSSCATTGPSLTTPLSLVINNSNLYILSGDDNAIYNCPIESDGTVSSTCVTMALPANDAADAMSLVDNNLTVSVNNAAAVLSYPVSSDGAIGDVNIASLGLNGVSLTGNMAIVP